MLYGGNPSLLFRVSAMVRILITLHGTETEWQFSKANTRNPKLGPRAYNT